jgi:hypothetical protein
VSGPSADPYDPAKSNLPAGRDVLKRSGRRFVFGRAQIAGIAGVDYEITSMAGRFGSVRHGVADPAAGILEPLNERRTSSST